MRLSTHEGLYAWEFEKEGHKLNVRVDGQMTFNTPSQMLEAAINGMGLAYVAEQRARTYIDEGCLAQVLEDWCPTFPGFHMYYASRRQSSRVMRLLVDALRYQR